MSLSSTSQHRHQISSPPPPVTMCLSPDTMCLSPDTGREGQKQRSFGANLTGEGVLRIGRGSKKVGGGYKIEIVFAESESEVKIGQFGREGQKQRSFGPQNMVFGVKMGQKILF